MNQKTKKKLNIDLLYNKSSNFERMKFSLIFVILIIALSLSVNTQGIRSQVIEDQLTQLLTIIQGKTVAMLTNPTSVDGSMRPLFDRIIAQSKNVTFKCFFAPQHGLRGDQQAGQGDQDYIDPQTGIQVYSLYGVRKAPTNQQLQGVEILIYDIQDVGARYYTYIWTLTYTIQACAKNNINVVIFDRPNPIGRKIEGCPLRIEAGLVGRLLTGQNFTLPQRYGLTVGQFIGYLRPYLPFFRLYVLTMSRWYQIKDSQWVLSSPNVPTMDTVFLYSGIGLIEDTSVSEGRGTTKPFQLTGNPNVNARDILNYFKNKSQQTGYGKTFLIRQAYFIPTFEKYVSKVCGGSQIHVIDRENFESVKVALHMIKAYLSAIKDGSMNIPSNIDIMFGVRGFFQNIKTKQVDQILKDCEYDRNLFVEMSNKVKLYDKNGFPIKSIL